jgi:hypothetical protein
VLALELLELAADVLGRLLRRGGHRGRGRRVWLRGAGDGGGADALGGFGVWVPSTRVVGCGGWLGVICTVGSSRAPRRSAVSVAAVVDEQQSRSDIAVESPHFGSNRVCFGLFASGREHKRGVVLFLGRLHRYYVQSSSSFPVRSICSGGSQGND